MSISVAPRRKAKIFFLWAFTVAVIIVVCSLPRIAQPPEFHGFADHRTVLGIPNFFNVVTNLIFLAVGWAGFRKVYYSNAGVEITAIYFALFLGVVLTALGSAWYHLDPNNERLVFDRLPMVIIFMSFLSAVIAEWVSTRAGAFMLPVLLLTGIASVIWWRATEAVGKGDLRPYLMVQFYPMVLIVLIMLLFATKANAYGLGNLALVIGWYIAAKALEGFDHTVYQLTGFISGHSLKHVAAGAATWYMVRFYMVRHRPRAVLPK